MVHGSLVKIKPNEGEDEALENTWNKSDPRLVRSQSVDIKFIILKELKFSSSAKAISMYKEFVLRLPSNEVIESYGVALRPQKELRLAREITLLRVNNNQVSAQHIVNPSWAGRNPVKRNLAMQGLTYDVSGAMQSQLFAMLDASGSNSRWMQSFSLKDKQQKEMYQWQKEYFEGKNVMSAWEMVDLMKNVLNDARLPWIKLEFTESGNACMFAISSSDGKMINQEGSDKKENGVWDWLQKMDDIQYEKVGEIDKGYKIRISDMKLIMVMDWAMSPEILLHELAHYISFCHPTPYRLNKGELKLSFSQYEDIFCGHGSAYMAVFSRLLIDYMYLDEAHLQDSIQAAGLSYFPIRSIRVDDLTHGITSYIKK
jgi:hypothetical protein